MFIDGLGLITMIRRELGTSVILRPDVSPGTESDWPVFSLVCGFIFRK